MKARVFLKAMGEDNTINKVKKKKKVKTERLSWTQVQHSSQKVLYVYVWQPMPSSMANMDFTWRDGGRGRGRGLEGCISLSNSTRRGVGGAHSLPVPQQRKLHSSVLHPHSPITSALLHVMLIHMPQYRSLASDNFCQQHKTRLIQSPRKPRIEASEEDWSRLHSNKCTISKQDIFCTGPITPLGLLNMNR